MYNDLPIGHSDWIEEDGLTERDDDGNIVPLSDRITCDYGDCTEAAAAFYRHQCCKQVCLACIGHTNGIMRYLVELTKRGNFAKCVFCNRYKQPTALITRPQPLRYEPPAA